MSQDTKVCTDNLTASIGATLNAVLLADKKLGTAVAGDILDLSAAQGIQKLGPTSTTMKFDWAWTTTNTVDSNANNIYAMNAGSCSSSTSLTHNYAAATPTWAGFCQTSGTAAAETITLGATALTLSASSTGEALTAKV